MCQKISLYCDYFLCWSSLRIFMWRASRRNSKKSIMRKIIVFNSFLFLLSYYVCLLWERKVHPLAIFFLFFIFLSFVARSFLSFASLSVNFSDKSLDLPRTYVQYTQREKNWELSNKAEWELFGGWKNFTTKQNRS